MALVAPLVLSLFPKGRVCPKCGGRKGFYAECCRACKVWPKPLLGKKGPSHPTWKSGTEIDQDGYIRTYAPDHPWPRKNSYVPEHVRLMELSIGRRLTRTETVHHRDHNRQNNAFTNLELIERSAHSRHHRKLDSHLRARDAKGRFV